MEAFSLLKYWRGSGAGAGATGATAIATTVAHQTLELDEDEGDEGSFFDMEFTVPDDDDEENEEEDSDSAGTDGDSQTDPNPSLSPSDELFFKGRTKPQYPVSLLKSATKFRVFTLGSKKPKSPEKSETIATPKQHQQQWQTQAQQQSKFFTVKFKVEEVPIVSLFTRDNSSRSLGSKLQKQNLDEAASDDKRFSKDVVHKYLKMIKPLYVRVSKRYGEKLRFSGQLSVGSVPVLSPTKILATKKEGGAEKTEARNIKRQKQGNFPAGLRVVCKHLGKSRSASSAVAAAPSVPFRAKRRDDSLLQQQDGIQSAILHCKRSFTGSRDSETSLLSKSTSDPSQDNSIDSSRNSYEEAKEIRI
ncbi:hypothetical protein HHK36_000140 [Tetracentron sinense]|uniref:Membrane-associated kinase regulator 2 n=1 Tax=Tetracentron sinense TaxID=13715 RepID=A0A834ZRQ5_TETSI|nr:hypothetical protein HHK36_000140 [Tetracentron sinense]